jgi:uncharacterized repeat protein (TIGR03803 family)
MGILTEVSMDARLLLARVFSIPRLVIATVCVVASPTTGWTQSSLEVLHAFTGGEDGGTLQSALIEGTDGNFYGATLTGGWGGIFRMTPDGDLTVVHHLSFIEGFTPPQPIQASDGNFYGTCANGGDFNLGTIFRMTPDGDLMVLHAFAGGLDGGRPFSGLLEAADGNFYGTTYVGGTFDRGTTYRMTPDGTVTVLHAFAGGMDGASPYSALIQGADGNFYGTTPVGGQGGWGIVFRMTADGALTILHAFDGTEGLAPYGIMQATDGNFYGTTINGLSNHGIVYQMTPDGVVRVLHAFVGSPDDGAGPFRDVLMQASDGAIYGTTEQGGTNDLGTVFRVCLDGTFTLLHSFTIVEGAGPSAAVVEGSDGNLYGTTFDGGDYNRGTAFRLVPDGALHR